MESSVGQRILGSTTIGLPPILVSAEDYNFCLQYNWLYNSATGYVMVHNPSLREIYLHHVIANRMGLIDYVEIDHFDRNKLNNCRDNLRGVTVSRNRKNSSPRKSASGYKYIQLDKRSMLWQVRIKCLPLDLAGGQFDSLSEAVKKRDMLIAQHSLDVYI